MSEQRLQKILAQAGVASRRGAEEIIRAGRVRVDGVVVDQMGTKADPTRQEILVDGKPLAGREQYEYWMVHKPAGVVSTVRDPEGRTRVVDLLPAEVNARLYPVGRLDLESEGLMLLTNDGPLAHRLMHPRFQVAKNYRVWVKGFVGPEALERLRRGVPIEGGVSAPARVHVKSASRARSKLTMVITEGRKREIRQMCREVGNPVKRLLRVGLGPLRLGDLPPGAVRRLTPREIRDLKKL